MPTNSVNRFQIQDGKYEFPYHYTPYFDNDGTGMRTRTLRWGWEYLTYLKHIQELVNSLRPATVLDVGCGDGRLIGMFDDTIARKVGVDLSERAIRFAQAFHPTVDFKVIDACQVEEIFDVVVAMEVLEHIPNEQVTGFLQTLAARTKVGGHIIISVPTTVMPLNQKHFRHYDRALLLKQLNEACPNIEIVTTDYIYRHHQLISYYLSLTQNSKWMIEIKAVNRLIWRYIWHHLRIADEKHGRHLVMLLQKNHCNN